MGSFIFVKTKAAISQDGLPKDFLNRFGQHVTGFFSGLDRVRFRATLRPLFCPNGPEVYLNYCKVLIKNFKGFAQGLSDRVKKLAYDRFQQAGRPNIYLPNSLPKSQPKNPRETARSRTSECKDHKSTDTKDRSELLLAKEEGGLGTSVRSEIGPYQALAERRRVGGAVRATETESQRAVRPARGLRRPGARSFPG
jgi:hypothetical protein